MSARGQVLGLSAHIFDLGQLQRAVLLGLGKGGAGVLVWTWTLKAVSSSPDDQAVPDAVEIGAEGLQIHLRSVLAHDKYGVKAKVMSSAGIATKSALSAGADSSSTGISSPRSSFSMPWRMSRKPVPPASTTPAFFQNRVLVDGVGQGLWPLPNGGLQN